MKKEIKQHRENYTYAHLHEKHQQGIAQRGNLRTEEIPAYPRMNHPHVQIVLAKELQHDASPNTTDMMNSNHDDRGPKERNDGTGVDEIPNDKDTS